MSDTPPLARPARSQQALLLFLALALIGVIAAWMWSEWPGRTTGPATPTPGTATGGGDDSAGTLDNPPVTVVEAPRVAPQLAPVEGAVIDFGEVQENQTVTRIVTLRHTRGRTDPVSFATPRIVLSSGENAPTLDLAEPDSCASGAAFPDERGRYCTWTLTWTARADERMNATLEAEVEPFVTRAMIQEAKTLADRPGGWAPYTLRVNLTGAGAAPRPPLVAEALPDLLGWDNTLDARPQASTWLRFTGRPVTVTGLDTSDADRLRVLTSRTDDCAPGAYDAREEAHQCALRVEWTPQPEDTEVDGQVTVRFRETAAEEVRTLSVAVRGTRQRLTAPGAGPDPRLRVTPSPIALGALVAGETRTMQRVEIHVHDASAVLSSVEPSLEAAGYGIRVRESDAAGAGHRTCTRAFTPGDADRSDWCLLDLEVAPPADAAPTPETTVALEIVWRAADRDTPPERTLIPMTLAVTEPALADTATRRSLRPGVLEVSTERVQFNDVGAQGTTQWVALSRASGAPVRFAGARLRAAVPDASLTLDASDCQSVGELATGNYCEIALRWTPAPGATLDHALVIDWSTQGARQRTTVPVTGAALAALPPPPPPPPIRASVRARLEFNRARAAARLSDTDFVTEVFTRSAQAAPATLRLVDPDLSGAGLDWTQSGRPVDLSGAVLEGTPIGAVLRQRVNALSPGPVSATVESDVWGGHGRTRVLPRGTLLIGVNGGLQGGTTLTVSGARADFTWRYALRPDGTAFALDGGMWTGDLMSAPGVPAVVDPYEWETWINVLSDAGLRALLIMAGPEKNLVEVMTRSVTGDEVARSEHVPSKKEEAFDVLYEGLGNVGALVTQLHQPPPTAIVPAGTRMTLYPKQGLKLRPIERIPTEAEADATDTPAPEAAPARTPEETPAQTHAATPPPPQGATPDLATRVSKDLFETPENGTPSWTTPAHDAGAATLAPTTPPPPPPPPPPRADASPWPVWPDGTPAAPAPAPAPTQPPPPADEDPPLVLPSWVE